MHGMDPPARRPHGEKISDARRERIRRLRIGLLGPQGAGKGTQASALAAAFGLVRVGGGALLHASSMLGTAEGVAGRERQDDLVTSLVLAEVARLDGAGIGFVLDGYPRTMRQVVGFAASGLQPLDVAVELSAPLRLLLDRLACRRVCATCGATLSSPAATIDTVACPCGRGTGVRRADDAWDEVPDRLARYALTFPVAAWFHEAGRLLTVSGEGSPLEVHARLVAALEGFASEPVAVPEPEPVGEPASEPEHVWEASTGRSSGPGGGARAARAFRSVTRARRAPTGSSPPAVSQPTSTVRFAPELRRARDLVEPETDLPTGSG